MIFAVIVKSSQVKTYFNKNWQWSRCFQQANDSTRFVYEFMRHEFPFQDEQK